MTTLYIYTAKYPFGKYRVESYVRGRKAVAALLYLDEKDITIGADSRLTATITVDAPAKTGEEKKA